MKSLFKLLCIGIWMVSSIPVLAQESRQDSTKYVINGKTVRDFDGSQLVGKVIDSYLITSKGTHYIDVHDDLWMAASSGSSVTVEESFDKNGNVVESHRTESRTDNSSNCLFIINGKITSDPAVYLTIQESSLESVTMAVKGSEEYKKYEGKILEYTDKAPQILRIVRTNNSAH